MCDGLLLSCVLLCLALVLFCLFLLAIAGVYDCLRLLWVDVYLHIAAVRVECLGVVYVGGVVVYCVGVLRCV